MSRYPTQNSLVYCICVLTTGGRTSGFLCYVRCSWLGPQCSRTTQGDLYPEEWFSTVQYYSLASGLIVCLTCHFLLAWFIVFCLHIHIFPYNLIMKSFESSTDGPNVGIDINSFQGMALHREPPLRLKSVFWWSSILCTCSFLPLYRGKCYTKCVSTNSY